MAALPAQLETTSRVVNNNNPATNALILDNLGLTIKGRVHFNLLTAQQARNHAGNAHFAEDQQTHLWTWTLTGGNHFLWKNEANDWIECRFDSITINNNNNNQNGIDEVRFTMVNFNNNQNNERNPSQPDGVGPGWFVREIAQKRLCVEYAQPAPPGGQAGQFLNRGRIYVTGSDKVHQIAANRKFYMDQQTENQPKSAKSVYNDNNFYDYHGYFNQDDNYFNQNQQYQLNQQQQQQQQQPLLLPQYQVLPVQYGLNNNLNGNIGQNNNNNGNYMYSQEWLAVILPILLISACLFGIICMICMGFGGLFCYREGQKANKNNQNHDPYYHKLTSQNKQSSSNKYRSGLADYDESV